MNQLEEYLRIATDLAKKSGDMMIEWHKKGSFQIDTKSNPKDLVTEVDIKIEKFIFDSLKQHFPNHRFIGEESVASSSSVLDSDDPTWIVDPIDGTMNFAHHSPWCCVSIGLAIDQQLVLGVINCPFLERLYCAYKGGGARCNDIPIHVSKRIADDIEKAMVLCDIPFGMQHPRMQKLNRKLFETIYWKCQGFRAIGSCCISMCFVADGSVDAFFMHGIKIWDMAAGYVIIKEAGGTVLNINGENFDPNGGNLIAASNPVLASKMAENVKYCRQSSKQ